MAPVTDEGTRLMPPVDDDATRLPPVADEATRLMPPADDATRLMSPIDDDATRLGPPAKPVSGSGSFAPRYEKPTDVFSSARGSSPARSSAADGHPEPGGEDRGPLMPGQSFGDRYHIVRLLGLGGMGAVYQAWDEELGVIVAVKVIRPGGGPDAAQALERRFKQELLLARQVTHRNVVRIHDLGEMQGIKYITMPYIQGEDLSTILKREGRLTVQQTLKIARSMLSGLAAAHAAGVVHRDLKPANIMINSEGEALIMDFGIARSMAPAVVERDGGVGLARGLTNAGQTVHGAVVGTIEYMAPEQARAQPIDQRADIYAAGLILYDLLLGRTRASQTDSVLAELNLRMKEPPPPPRSKDPSVPDALDRIITRCIQPDPEARFATTAELVAELDKLDENGKPLPIARRLTRRMTVTSALAVLALLVVTWWFSRGPAPAVQRPALPVLIATFDNRVHEPLFEKTLEQALAIGVEGASFLTVYPTRAAERVAAQINPGAALDETNARLVAVREGIKVVLAGSVDARGNGYTIEVKALQPDGKVITTVSSTAADKQAVLKEVGSLATRIRRALGDTAPPKPGEMESFTTVSLQAASLFSQARVHSAAYRDEDAIKLYKAAVEQDPNFGRAYAGWANGAFRLGRLDESREAWKKALSLVERMTEREKYRTLGLYYGTVSQNYAQAIENYKQLVKNYPADGAGHNNLAVAYFNTLAFQLALDEAKRAIEVEPTNLLYQGNSALFAMYASDFNTAAAQAGRIVQQNPAYHPAYFPLAIAAQVGSNSAGAIETYQKMAKASPAGASIAQLGLADVAIYAGRFDDAVAILRPAIADDETRKNKAGMIAKYSAVADAYAGGRKAQQAREAARKALALAGEEINAVPAARALAALGNDREILALTTALSAKLQPQSRAYGKILEGEVALHRRKMVEAVEAFRAAQKIADLWLTHFDLGVAYIEAGQYPEGLAELELCLKRRGEAAALLLDDLPSYRYAATLPYWLGRAKEELGMAPAAADHYTAFLALRPNSPNDPLVVHARKRAATAR